MNVVIPSTNYKILDKEGIIILMPPYNEITVEQILFIRNLTKNIIIYDCTTPTSHPISMADGAIIYSNTDGTDASDKLQIVINGILSGGTP